MKILREGSFLALSSLACLREDPLLTVYTSTVRWNISGRTQRRNMVEPDWQVRDTICGGPGGNTSVHTVSCSLQDKD